MRNFKTFNLIGKVNEDMEKDFSKFLNDVANSPTTPILIAINSPGGNVYNGFSIYNKLQALSNPVYTLVTGYCSSITNIILLAVPFEQRFAFRNTKFFMHSAKSQTTEKYESSDYKNELDNINHINDTIKEIILNETKITKVILTDVYQKTGSVKTYYSDEFEKLKIANVISKYEDIYAKHNISTKKK